MGKAELVQQKAFLGKEFLTWLWYRAEEDPAIELDRGKRCEIEFMDQLVLEAQYGDAKSSLLRGESPASSPEAAVALREGKKVKRARIKFCYDGSDWITMIEGESLTISGLKMPNTGRLPFEESLQLRLDFAVEFERILSELYRVFLEGRLDEKDWGGELKKIQKWVGKK